MSDTRKDPALGRAGEEQVQSNGQFISDEEMKQRLSDELDELLENATETDLDVDKLDGLLAALDELDPLPKTEALDTEAGLRRLHARLAEQASAGDEPAESVSSISSETHRTHTRTVWRLLLVAAILVLMLAMPVQGGRNLFKLLIGQTSEVFRTGSSDVQYAQITKQPLELKETRYYDSVPDMLDDFGVTAPLFPAWIPDRFTEPEICASRSAAGNGFYVDFRAEDGFLLMQATEIFSAYSRKIESNQLEGQIILLNGIDYYLVSDVNTEKASWQNGTLDCIIYGTVTQDEMQKMIRSIYGG